MFWRAVIYVMGRLKVWKPYVVWIEAILDRLAEEAEG